MNRIKTAVLLAGMTALFGFVGLAIGGKGGMMIALLIALAMNLASYWFSDKIVLRMHHAQPAQNGPLHHMTQRLAQRAGLPMPKVYMIESPQPNAFATGRNPDHAVVAVSSGLTRILTEREMEGVLAHELAHVKNRDTLTMTVTAAIAGAISMLANFGLFFGGGQNGRGNLLTSLLIMFLAPMAAMLVQMAISRTREYSADRLGAEICGDPHALADALEKLEASAKRVHNPTAEDNPATAHMFIVNPLRSGGRDNLFSTHPNTANRIAALREMAGGGGKSAANRPRGRSRPVWMN